MNKCICLAVLAAAALCGCEPVATPKGLPAATLDKGGTTFDFKAISDRRFDFSTIPEGDAPGNMLPADGAAEKLPRNYQEWHKYLCYNSDSLPSGSPLRSGLHKHVYMSRTNGTFSVNKDDRLYRYCADAGRTNLYCCAEGTWRRYVRLPDAKGGAYRLSVRYKMRHTAPQIGYGTIGLIIIHAWKLNADGRDYVHISRPACASLADGFSEWRPTVVDFDVPTGADIISVQLRHDGIGDLVAKDVFLSRQKAVTDSSGMTIRLSPSQLLDNAFALSEGQCGQLTWEWRKDDDDAFDPKDSTFQLKLSPGFEFAGDTFGQKADVAKAADGSSVVTFTGLHRSYRPGKALQSWTKPAMLVKSVGKSGTEGVCSLSAWRGGRKTGDSGPVRLLTLPAIRTPSPERYLYAAMPGAPVTINFRQPEACEMFAKFLADIGIRQLACENSGWIDCANVEVYKRALRAAGVRRLTPCSHTVANGYYIGNHSDIPEGDRFVTDVKDGAWSGYVKRGLCPLVVIEERPYFREKVLPGLKKRLAGCDGLRANWEPFMFLHHGCYCGKCRAKFAAWAKVGEAELAANWPGIVKPGAKHGKAWTRFRSLEQAEVVKTLDRHVKEFTGGENSLGFIPAITWREMNSMWRKLHPSSESEPFDYATDITTIGTWGPYVIWDAAKPYNYSKRAPLIHFIASKDVREQTDRDYPEGKRPILLGGTQGLQCGEWVTQPEWLEMAMDSYFFNGFHGTQAYFFPEGLDARYAAGYARSAARAARYEKAVWDGRRCDASVALEPVAEYAMPATRVTDYLPDYKNVPMLQKAVFDHAGGRTVAVFNFWEKGEAFFDLKASGLAGDWVVVDEAGVLYAKDAATASWTAEELARGVRLQVGAARTRVFELRPASESALADVKSVMTAEAMAAACEAARPALKKAAEADAKYEAANGGKTKRDTKAEI